MLQVEPQQLKAFLLDAGLVSEGQFEEARVRAERTNQEVGDILVSDGLISQEKLVKMKAYILGIPFVNLESVIISPETLKIIPEPIARSNNIISFRMKGQELEVAMLDPKDLRTIEFIKRKSNLKILPRLTTQEGIKNALRQYAETLEAEFGDIIKKDSEGIKTIREEESDEENEEEELKKVAEEVTRIVDVLIRHAILQKASDIHIEPTEKEVIVRYRIDGILRGAMTLPKRAGQGIVARIKVLSNLKLDEHRLPQDGRFKVETNEYKYSVRVSILPVFDGEKIVMRLLPETSKAFTLEELGFRGKALEAVQAGLRKPVGMILVTGPTGSGKTTTLYSMLEILNDPGVNISTIEDPVEYRMPRINQTQVRANIGLTFATGLRSLVRQDPNIIMVGEIRDNETASLAINAALTGHMVLSTLHTTSAAGTIPRMIDMKVEPFLLSSTINIILAQRLVRKIKGEKEKYTLSEKEAKKIAKYCDIDKVLEILKEERLVKPKDEITDVVFYKPKPSKEYPDGYSGRIGIYEVLEVSEATKKMIVEEANSDQIQEQAQKEGMRIMIEDGFIKAAEGLTSIEEVLRVISE